MLKPMIAVCGVSKRFGKKEVLRDVSLEVRPSHIVGLLGPSGAGKTRPWCG
jgi:lipopolysaccharide export system ATP-binding protein